jgi:hypothetical protein
MFPRVVLVAGLAGLLVSLSAVAGGAATPRQGGFQIVGLVSAVQDGKVTAQDCNSGIQATLPWPAGSPEPEVGKAYPMTLDLTGGIQNAVVTAVSDAIGTTCPGQAPGQTPGPANHPPICPERTEVTMGPGTEQVIHGNCWDQDEGDVLHYFDGGVFFTRIFMSLVGDERAEEATQVNLKIPEDFEGDDTFKYGASDDKAGSNIATMIVHVRQGVEFSITTFDGTAQPDHLTGSDSQDTLDGNGGADTIEGGAGPDLIEGGAGNDVLTDDGGITAAATTRAAGKAARGARNRIRAGAGNDRVDVANGVRDTVDCGPGRDRAKVDRRDKVKRCEKVTRSR